LTRVVAHARLTRAAVAAIIIALAAGAFMGAPASASGHRFSDVPSSHQFRAEITWLANQGISTGYADGTFRPKSAVTREAFAAFLYRLEGSPRVTLSASSPFKDVKKSDQFYTEIVWLAKKGITTGWPDGTFRPRDNISREAMAAFLYRASGDNHWYEGAALFTDVPKSAKFYREIDWLATEGITTGYDTGYGCREYRPKDAVSREATAAFLYRYDTGKGTPLYSTNCNPPSQPSKPAFKHCSDFATQAQAQAWFLKNFPTYFDPDYGDFSLLDGDGDMIACEHLP
ncbi:MAG: S-layer homology domain-containing protein, partial [Demequina sp.]|uniref:S-layer homology domain-containing protein n=1 Tax=Demequina sp. TaxID=2050685 RepID=UPI003A89D0AC